MQIRVQVKPNSGRGDSIEQTPDGLIVFLRAKAIDGAANKALIETLAQHFDVPKTKIQIQRGEKSRFKTIIIA